jgi:hypothetical protein
MSGLMRRLSRGRAAAEDETAPSATGTSEAAGDAATEPPRPGEPPVAEPATSVLTPEATTAAAPDAAVVAEEEPVPGRDLPAGVDLDELAAAPADSAGRGRLRRRLRYLRRVRELLLRDLGGFYAEAHRSEPGADAHRRLLDAKARRIATLDVEVRELEGRLSEPHAETVLREPGVGGTCPECGELHGSDARFCSRCGNPLTGRAGAPRTSAAAPAAPAAPKETTASLWGRPKRPAPEPSPEPASMPEAAEDGATTGSERA